MSAAPQSAFHHASCVVVGEAGVLIRGPSGSGKSTLAREILDLAARRRRLRPPRRATTAYRWA